MRRIQQQENDIQDEPFEFSPLGCLVMVVLIIIGSAILLLTR